MPSPLGIGEAVLALTGGLWRDASQARVLRARGHRPHPLEESRPWVIAQSWNDLLFAHWRVPVEALRPAVPAELPIDTWDGSAWIGVTPFVVSGFRPRGIPPVPVLSSFPEINVRTYTTVGGRPGIWFFSLDTLRRAGVVGARLAFRLPYFHAAMEVRRGAAGIDYASDRTSPGAPPARMRVRYRPCGPVRNPAPRSLEHFLTERYCLYAFDDEMRLHRAEIHHPPWPLQEAQARFGENTMAAPVGVELEGSPLLHYARRQDVVTWPLRRT